MGLSGVGNEWGDALFHAPLWLAPHHAMLRCRGRSGACRYRKARRMMPPCAYCGAIVSQPVGAVNRAMKSGLAIYCDRTCSGLGRRKNKTREQKTAEKAAYDAEYRKINRQRLKALKAAAYKANPNRERERAYRKANMGRHVEYCRRPEYREWKVQYDRQYRAQKDFGPFAAAALVILDLEREIASRATRYEIYAANGTLNKKLNRRREYETLCS